MASDSVCTSVCTNETETAHRSRVGRLALLIGELTPDERKQLAAMLSAQPAEGSDTKRKAKTKRRASKPKERLQNRQDRRR